MLHCNKSHICHSFSKLEGLQRLKWTQAGLYRVCKCSAGPHFTGGTLGGRNAQRSTPPRSSLQDTSSTAGQFDETSRTRSGKYASSSGRDSFGSEDSTALPGDQFAAFRSYQQMAVLQTQQGGDESAAGSRNGRPGSIRRLLPKLRKGWFSKPEYNVDTLYRHILQRCERLSCGVGPLFMIMKLAQTPEEAHTALSAIAAVRTSFAKRGNIAPFNESLCGLFVKMCGVCDAPEVLAEGLDRATELGLPLSYLRVHEVLVHWGSNLELHKIQQVVEAMPAGGLPPNSRTAYIVIRAAVNSGEMQHAEAFAQAMQQQGVRLHPTCLRLLELGRQRAAAHAAALSGTSVS